MALINGSRAAMMAESTDAVVWLARRFMAGAVHGTNDLTTLVARGITDDTVATINAVGIRTARQLQGASDALDAVRLLNSGSDALAGLDDVIKQIEAVKAVAARPYQLIDGVDLKGEIEIGSMTLAKDVMLADDALSTWVRSRGIRVDSLTDLRRVTPQGANELHAAAITRLDAAQAAVDTARREMLEAARHDFVHTRPGHRTSFQVESNLRQANTLVRTMWDGETIPGKWRVMLTDAGRIAHADKVRQAADTRLRHPGPLPTSTHGLINMIGDNGAALQAYRTRLVHTALERDLPAELLDVHAGIRQLFEPDAFARSSTAEVLDQADAMIAKLRRVADEAGNELMS